MTVGTGATLQFAPGSSGTSFSFANSFVLDGGTIKGLDGIQRLGTGVGATINVTANGGTIRSKWGTKNVFLDGQLTGSGPLTVENDGGGRSTVIITNNTNTYSGTLTLNAALLSGELLTIGVNNALQNATVNVNGTSGAFSGLSFSTTAPVFGALRGNGNFAITTGVTLSVGNNNSPTSYSGVMSDVGALTKVGSGTFTIVGANTYTGVTTVSTGILQIGDGVTEGTIAGTSIINNATLTYNTAGAAPAYAGAISGTGVVSKIGAGSKALTGGNIYTGATAVTGGTLTVSGTGAINASSGITINGSTAKYAHTSSVASSIPITLTLGTLDGTGTVGSVTVGAGTGGIVANGMGTTAALTIGTLTYSGAGTMSLIPLGGGSTAPGSAAPLVVSGTLSTTGAAGAITMNLAPASLFVNGSTYNLVSYGTFAGTASEFAIGTGLSARQVSASTFGKDTVNKFITLTVNGDNPVWSGANGGVWKTGTTNVVGATPSWALKTAQTATDFWNTDIVEFNDTVNLGAGPVAPATTFAAIEGGNVSPSAMTFNNTSLNYTVQSSDGSGIASGTLTKNGTGTVFLVTANTYVGATAVNAGTLNVSGSLDGTPITVASGATFTLEGVLANTAVTVGAGGNFLQETFSSGISGAASLTTSGTATLAAFNTFTGGVTLNAGTLRVNNAFALGSGAVTINGGILDNTSGFAVSLANNNTQSWNGDFTFAGTGDGTHDLQMGNGVVTLGGAGPARTVTVSAGTLTVGRIAGTGFGFTKAGAGTLTLAPTAVSSISGELNVTGGALNIGAQDFTATGLAGSGTISNGSGTTRWLIITNTADNVFSGTLQNGGGGLLGFSKSGAGKMTLSGANSYSDVTTLAVGTLVAASPTALGNTSRIQLSSGTTLIMASDGGDNLYPISTGTGTTATIVSDRATAGVGINHSLTTPAGGGLGGGLGGGTINVTSGANVTSGTGRITFVQLGFSAGSVQTTLLNPTTASVSVGDVTKALNTPNQTLGLGGTSTGNEVTGVISNGLAAANAVTKSDTSTWTLSGANTYTGPTLISAGTLRIGNGGATGSLAPASAITTNASLVFNRSDAPTQGTDFNSVIAGTGSVTQAGAGNLILNGVNTYTGGTVVNSGTLTLNGANTGTGIVRGVVTVNTGGTLQLASTTALGYTARVEGGYHQRRRRTRG